MSKAEYAVADLYEENASLRQRAERAERILAALRYPIAIVVDETWNAFDEYDGEMSGLIRHTIRAAVASATAAVAAAEQEVGRE